MNVDSMWAWKKTSDMGSNEQLATTASLELLCTCGFGIAGCGLSGGRQTPRQPTWSWMWTWVSRSTEIVNFISKWSLFFVFLSHHWFDSIRSSLSVFPMTEIFYKDAYSQFCLQDILAEKSVELIFSVLALKIWATHWYPCPGTHEA